MNTVPVAPWQRPLRGLVDSTAASQPHAQGYWAVLNLWQQHLGAPTIERIDAGISVFNRNSTP